MLRLTCVALMLIFMAPACSPPSNNSDGDGDGDSDGDVDGDVDGDGDGDSDGDSDADADADSDALDGDVDTGDDADVTADADVEAEAGPDDTDDDGDGFTEATGDCDDTNADIYPGSATPVPDRDYDCDGDVEWQVVITITADDSYDLCIDGVDIGTGASHSDAETWVVELESGHHVIGVHGEDTVGVTAGLAAEIRHGGRMFNTHGVRTDDLDATRWRYFPSESSTPQASWCDIGFDDSTWGPALLNDEVDDGAWLYAPIQLVGRDAEWIWDGRPRDLRDSWFRRRFDLPFAEPVIPDPPAIGCTVASPIALTPTTERLHSGVALAWDGTNLAALADTFHNPFDAGSDELFLHRITLAGAIVTPRTMVNVTGGSRRFWWNTNPAIAHSPAGFGVVWEDGRHDRAIDQIYFRRVELDGSVTGPELRLVSTGDPAKYPDVAFDGTNFVVCWQDERHNRREIYCARVSTAGALVGTAQRVTDSPGASRRPRIAHNPVRSELGVAWSDSRDGTDDDGNWEVYFQRLSATLAPVGAALRVTDGVAFSGHVDVAFDGTHYGVVWADERDDNREIYFARLSELGVLDPAVRVTDSGGVSANPVIVATATGWAVAFSDDRTGVEDIYLVELAADGTPAAVATNVSVSPGFSRRPRLVLAGTSYALIWEEEVDPVVGPYRVYPHMTSATCP